MIGCGSDAGTPPVWPIYIGQDFHCLLGLMLFFALLMQEEPGSKQALLLNTHFRYWLRNVVNIVRAWIIGPQNQ